LNKTTVKTNEFHRCVSALQAVTNTVAGLASPAVGKEFSRQALSISPKAVDMWANHMSDLLAAMTTGGQRRIAEMEKTNAADLAQQLADLKVMLGDAELQN
jgi:hypothetical protein